jgi:hypothetical protein
MESKNLFPVYFDGKEYLEKDCDDIFLSFYHSRESLNEMGGVYLFDGTWVYPDGSMDEF